jgi:hypothetical protein
MPITASLILKRASVSRPSGEWSDDPDGVSPFVAGSDLSPG